MLLSVDITVEFFNLINLFIPVVNAWMIVNSTNVVIEPIATGNQEWKNVITNEFFWNVIVEQSKRYGNE